jgi:DNA-binding beta-propeller fold protein YncE
MRLRLLLSCLLAAAASAASATPPDHPWPPSGHFVPLATFDVQGEVAEIVATTPSGRLLVYTDSESQQIGFVDITSPESPVQLPSDVLDMGGEPTSVAITPNGRWALVAVHGPDDLAVVRLSTREIVRRIPLYGQPDCVAISPNGLFAAIAIENEREGGDGEMPDDPPGNLTIINLVGPPNFWTTRVVSLEGIANRFTTDPEPEFVAIRWGSIAAVTLQENNHVVLVNLWTGGIVGDFEAGTTTHAADLQDDDVISFTDTLENARREPDAIAWTPKGQVVTANEGDYDLDVEFVGGRDFTIFKTDGTVFFEPGSSLEEAAAAEGLYEDSRSDSRGCEFEGVAVEHFRGRPYLFVGAERCDLVGVYQLDDEENPELIQLLSTGDRPEGLLAIPHRGLFVTANEGDGTLSIFEFQRD